MRNLPAQTNPTQIVGYLFRNGIQSKIDQICFKKGDYFTLAHFESLVFLFTYKRKMQRKPVFL